MTNRKKAILLWGMALIYMGIIYYLSSKQMTVVELPRHTDKIIHLLVYMPLGFILLLALRASGTERYALLFAFLIGSFYGGTDEFHQLFVPGRFADIGDFLADSAGVLFGAFAARQSTKHRLPG